MHLFSFRPEEFLHDCPYFALWSLDTVISMTSPNFILDILVRERSLRRGAPLSNPPPEQFFHPSNYNFGRYFTAFESGKLNLRSTAIYWFSCSLFVAQNPKQSQKNPNPPQTHLWLPCTGKVLNIAKRIWQSAEFGGLVLLYRSLWSGGGCKMKWLWTEAQSTAPH